MRFRATRGDFFDGAFFVRVSFRAEPLAFPLLEPFEAEHAGTRVAPRSTFDVGGGASGHGTRMGSSFDRLETRCGNDRHQHTLRVQQFSRLVGRERRLRAAHGVRALRSFRLAGPRSGLRLGEAHSLDLFRCAANAQDTIQLEAERAHAPPPCTTMRKSSRVSSRDVVSRGVCRKNASIAGKRANASSKR